MTSADRERWQVRAPVLLVTAAAWIMLVFEASGSAPHVHHSAATASAMPAHSYLPGVLPSFASMEDWALMLAAMMAPALIGPVRHVFDRSFARRRGQAIVLFITGYAAIWLAAGIPLLALAALLAAPKWRAPIALATLVAFVWQFSPFKQRCLNRCHAHSELAAFGLPADLDALRFGLTHGVWCVGSCWALMLVPLLVSGGHLALMALVALWVFAERLDRPMPLCWSWRSPSKVVRIAVAQTRMRLQHS